jgi:hypothetical protein
MSPWRVHLIPRMQRKDAIPRNEMRRMKPGGAGFGLSPGAAGVEAGTSLSVNETRTMLAFYRVVSGPVDMGVKWR